jgi:hypothetical protein
VRTLTDNSLARLDETVGCDDNWSRELCKFELLQLPWAAVVTNQVLVFAQARVTMSGQLYHRASLDELWNPRLATVSFRNKHHVKQQTYQLAVGVNIDSSAFSLLQDLLQVSHVVSTD